ncbi:MULTISPECIES: ATP-grasp domain-containing protein [Mesorhizobium]|uniref:D-alanine--D-alanine ligase family protein n=1 Tax=Mesorhizobium TaxID=68287 RepID=UPI0007A952DD|nr:MULTISPECIES: ATP-grasp domain-containing protein [Mesorhizobium]RUU24807.1 ATP-grasp domain-containing protein [Mesorhizobium sp. M7A.T.Ca.TU.009.01.3.2]RUV14783.1 ATP-grasp domain-containing protein [Mesorhizobium sp. M7A.T.Ca.TU.009.01.3.1]RUZ91316.1 ATP-grasp domain-containing protein [Mesorhizobium sp. M7A.F.Ca.US.003.02.2.1]RVA51786.1 ATP-grasp domain-containing protein [Mesorhizobium sp. M7A.F.Ca.US.001.01.1.1]WIE92724.1 ATP-grasp domain-containing protein [Mesorhizobium sp. WSM4875]
MRVAIVTNSDFNGVINRFGQPCPQPPQPWPHSGTLEDVVAALQEGGHETVVCEGDKGLLASLERFMPPDPQGRPSGMVFNLAEGIQGEKRYTHVPAMLEMAGVPYTGCSPFGIGLTGDKVITKMLIRDQGVPTPNFRVMRRGTENTGDLRFPVVVKPREEDCSFGLQIIHEHSKLRQAVEVIVTQHAQDALVEEYIEGREICVALLGNGEPEVLPLVEQDFGDRETRVMNWDAKYVAAAAVPKICPAKIESGLETMLRDISVATFRACHCRDYARVDFRIDRSGQPFVLEMNSVPALGIHSSYGTAATAGGHSFVSLINRILNVAHTRYFGIGVS